MRKNFKWFLYLMCAFAMIAAAASGMAQVSVNAAQKASISPKTVYMKVGDKEKLQVKKKPAGAKLTWRLSNQKAADISQKGVLTAKRVGTADIKLKVTPKKGKAYVVKGKVVVSEKVVSEPVVSNPVVSNPVSVNRITTDVSQKEMIVGEKFEIRMTISPADAANKSVTYTSSDSNVAAVSDAGIVTAKSVGEAQILIKAKDGSNVSATVAIVVKKVEESETTFKEKMESMNYYVQEGHYEYLDTLSLASQGKLISCFGNNAGSDYFVVKLPPAPEQDAAVGSVALGWDDETPTQYDDPEVENYPANPFVNPVGWTFKLQPDEAIVMIGNLPPESRYFSFLNYVFGTEVLPNKDYTSEKGFFEINGPEEVGNYHPIFGSLGAPLNNFNISSAATPNHTEGSPYGSKFVLVITGDQVTNDEAVAALKEAGYAKGMINESNIPAKTLSMGLEKGKDTFTVLGRLSQCTDQAERNDYVSAVEDRTTVYRITPKEKKTSKLYGQMDLTVRGSGTRETSIVPTAKQDLNQIRSELIEKYKDEYTYEELSSDIAVPEEITGYQNDRNSQGDNRDTSYLMTKDFTLNSEEDFIVVYGVNHTTTEKAVYSNAILYSRPMLNGVVSVYDTLFHGSSYAYLPESNGYRDNYYVYKMARESNTDVVDDYTKIIEYSSGNDKGKYYGVDNGATLLLAYRAYVEKATGVGPAYNEITYDRAIVFHKK